MNILFKKIAIVNRSHHPHPSYQTAGAAGMDLYAFLPKGPVDLPSLGRAIIPTGISIALPEGLKAEISPRSGLAAKQGVTVLNAPGLIDADYRGEIKVILVNLSDSAVEIMDGDRIAQMVVSAYVPVVWKAAEQLDSTPRGEGGLGSTGVRN